jgi:hypothetical protein
MTKTAQAVDDVVDDLVEACEKGKTGLTEVIQWWDDQQKLVGRQVWNDVRTRLSGARHDLLVAQVAAAGTENAYRNRLAAIRSTQRPDTAFAGAQGPDAAERVGGQVRKELPQPTRTSPRPCTSCKGKVVVLTKRGSFPEKCEDCRSAALAKTG